MVRRKQHLLMLIAGGVVRITGAEEVAAALRSPILENLSPRRNTRMGVLLFIAEGLAAISMSISLEIHNHDYI